MDIAFPALQQLEQKRRLAHSRFCDKREKPTPRFNPVEQRCESFPVSGTEIKVTRVRSHTEWLFTQFVEIEKHFSTRHSSGTLPPQARPRMIRPLPVS